MRPRRSGGVIICPSKRICPASNGSTPAMHSTSVVLPAPLGPMSPSTSPWRTVKETSDNASVRPYDFVRRSTASKGEDMAKEKSIGRGYLLPDVVEGVFRLTADAT